MIIELSEKVIKELDNLLLAGEMCSNSLYNLSQISITSQGCKEAYKAWDTAKDSIYKLKHRLQRRAQRERELVKAYENALKKPIKKNKK